MLLASVASQVLFVAVVLAAIAMVALPIVRARRRSTRSGRERE